MSEATLSCNDVELALLDEALPRPQGLEAHLRDCASCRGFRRSQAGALLLRGASPLVSRHAVPAWFSTQSWAARGLAAVTVCIAALVFWGGAWLSPPVKASVGEGPVVKVAPADVQVRVKVSPPDVEVSGQELQVVVAAPGLTEADDAEFNALASLRDGVVALAHRDAVARDAVYRPYGSLALWVAPETTHPIRSLGRAIHPLVSTSED